MKKKQRLYHVCTLPGLLLLLTPMIVSARSSQQTPVLTGTVSDVTTQEMLSGVTLLFRDSPYQAQTDEKGAFSIRIPTGSNKTLVVKLLGYVTKELAIHRETAVQIQLEKEQILLDEVVAIGYATVNRQDLTGAVSSLNQRQLKDIPVNSAAEALTGRLAGVQVTTSEGTPGAEVQIRVRGGGSITQDNSPLYIIDGIQVDDGLNSLSPQDIASIDVLKDASATAIYGARGANGVVIITTKGGREMKPQISYSNILGTKTLANKLAVMQPYDFVVRQYERTRGSTQEETGFANTYGSWSELDQYRDAEFIDWQQRTFGNNAGMQTHNLSLTGGTNAVQYNLSLTSNHEDGVMLHSDFDRKLVNFRFDNQINRALKVGFNVRYNNQKIGGAGTSDAGSVTYNMLRHTIKYRPLLIGNMAVDEVDEDYYTETNPGNAVGIINPIQLSEAQYQQRRTQVTNLNGYAGYVFNKYLSFRSTLGINFNNNTIDYFDDGITSRARTQGARLPMVRLISTAVNSLNNSNVLTFKYRIPNAHSVDVLLGHELYNLSSSREENQLRYFPDGITPQKALGQLNLGTVIPTYPVTYQSEARTVSFFSRANYSYGSKYLASFSIRADASSRFASDKRWGYFPSGSVAWRISEEPFLKDAAVISDMKVRASYGTSGNDRINDYLFMDIFTTNARYALNEQIVPGFSVANLANRNLVWETTVSQNIGLDISLFRSRVQVTADIYRNRVRDLLLNVPIPSTSGYPTQLQNIGNTSNRGLEFQVNATLVNRESFNWNSSFNLSFNRNRIDKLSNQQDHYFSYSGFGISGQPADFIVQEGQPVGAMFGYVYDGIYTIDDFNYDPATSNYTLKEGVTDVSGAIGIAQPGWMKLRDLDGNGTIDEHDKTIIGNANPKFSGGLHQQFTYKQFDMSVFVNFVYGNTVFNANAIEFTNGYTGNANALAVVANRWRTIDADGNVVQRVVTEGGQQVVKGAAPETLAALNRDASFWIPISGAGAWYPTSWAMEDGSFLRINNVTLGYTLPERLSDRIRIRNLRIYGTVNNLAVFTRYSGYDPEVNTRRSTTTTPGVDYSAYPRSRSFVAGLNISL